MTRFLDGQALRPPSVLPGVHAVADSVAGAARLGVPLASRLTDKETFGAEHDLGGIVLRFDP